MIKKKIKPLNKLVKELDDIFSQFIRLRDSDSNGICHCISCGSFHFWKYIQNGHYNNREHMSTRYDEINCNAQCEDCNIIHRGNINGYKKGLIQKYGKSVIDDLYSLKHQTVKFSCFELQELINHYKKEVAKLKKEKNL